MFTPRLFLARLCELHITPLSCVGLLTAKSIYISYLLLSPLAPDRAPTILSVTPHTTTSVLVRWQVNVLKASFHCFAYLLKSKPYRIVFFLQPPSEDHINGVLLGFRVRYRELHYDRLRSFSVRTVNSPSSKWADLTGDYICFYAESIAFQNGLFCKSHRQYNRLCFYSPSKLQLFTASET